MFVVIYRGDSDPDWRACSYVYDEYQAAVLEATHLEKQGLKARIIRLGLPLHDAREEYHEY